MSWTDITNQRSGYVVNCATRDSSLLCIELTFLCVVIQTHKPIKKGVLLSRSNWMAQPFSELSGCRFLSRWFPHKQCSNYCQRSSLQWKHGTAEFRVLPTDAVLNILMMDSYHATSRVVVLPQAGNVWKRIGVIGVADNLRQWFLTCDHNRHQHLSTLKDYCEESSIGVYIHFLDVVISLFITLFEKHNTRSVDRLKKILHGSVCLQNVEFFVSRLSAFHYRCRALSVSRWHRDESRKFYFLSAVCKSWFQIFKAIIKTRHGGAMVAAWELCSPHTKLADLSVAAIDFNKWGTPSHRSISWEVQLVKNTWGHGQMLDSDCFFRNHWGGVRFWLGYIMEMPSARSREQLCNDIGQSVRSGWMRDEIKASVRMSRWNHPNLLLKRSPLQKRIGLLTLLAKAQTIRGLVTESSGDSTWILETGNSGAIIKALGVKSKELY